MGGDFHIRVIQSVDKCRICIQCSISSHCLCGNFCAVNSILSRTLNSKCKFYLTQSLIQGGRGSRSSEQETERQNGKSKESLSSGVRQEQHSSGCR